MGSSEFGSSGIPPDRKEQPSVSTVASAVFEAYKEQPTFFDPRKVRINHIGETHPLADYWSNVANRFPANSEAIIKFGLAMQTAADTMQRFQNETHTFAAELEQGIIPPIDDIDARDIVINILIARCSDRFGESSQFERTSLTDNLSISPRTDYLAPAKDSKDELEKITTEIGKTSITMRDVTPVEILTAVLKGDVRVTPENPPTQINDKSSK